MVKLKVPDKSSYSATTINAMSNRQMERFLQKYFPPLHLRRSLTNFTAIEQILLKHNYYALYC